MSSSSTAIERVPQQAIEQHGEHGHGHGMIEFTPHQRLRMNRLGFWLFIISEAFLFSGILVARVVLLRDDNGATRPELDQALGLLITAILLISSFAVNLGELAIANGNRSLFQKAYGAAILMGLVFVVGVGYEWTVAAHFSPSDHIEGGMFFFMTGIHTIHVITGIVFLAVIFFNGRRGQYSKSDHWAVEASAVYWHFVDVVWVFFYVALYLIGNVPELHP